MSDVLPDWVLDLTAGEIITFWIGVAVIIGAIAKFWKPVRKFFKGIDTIVTDWTGTIERRDPITDTVLEPAVPGIVTQIKILKDQLENSHQESATPNLRDDLDTKASKDDVAAVATAIEELTHKVSEHITISKESDRRQDHTESTLSRYLPILKQLAGEE